MFMITPWSAALFMAGLLSVTAAPPFGSFFSELAIVRAAFATGKGWAAWLFLGSLLLAFLGLTRVIFAIVYGRPRRTARASEGRFRETAALTVPPLMPFSRLPANPVPHSPSSRSSAPS